MLRHLSLVAKVTLDRRHVSSFVQLSLACLSTLTGLLGVRSARAEVLVRVEITQAQGTLAIGTSTPALITDHKDQILGTLPPLKRFFASPQGRGLLLNGVHSPVLRVKPSGDGLVSLNGTWYHGEMILAGYNSALVVNYVDLENYVASVVDAEMGASFHPEALKAQAVAARSYVLYHRNSRPWFDVHSDTRSQVYRGLSRQGPSQAARAAAAATRGVVLTYDGRLINAMYSASSGGYTVGVQGFPYLSAVPDVTSRPKYGHGIGMSQWGAQEMAVQGRTFRQILGHYYRGVGLARIPE